ncbi:MAG: hypothetical protein HY924_06155 [Elusimicrobia bacterium]|nr:hypothetical protein [Elusimicrobiota bacterium]
MTRTWALLASAGLACASFLAFAATRDSAPRDQPQVVTDGFSVDQPPAVMRDAVASGGPLMLGARFVPPPPALSAAFGPGMPAGPKPAAAAGPKKPGLIKTLLSRLRRAWRR